MEEQRQKRERGGCREGGQREIAGTVERGMDGGRAWREVKSGPEWTDDGKLRKDSNIERKARDRREGPASDSHICVLGPSHPESALHLHVSVR